MFSKLRDVEINGGTFIQNNNVGRTGFDLLSSKVADRAFYDSENGSNDARDRSRGILCDVPTLEAIQNWITDDIDNKPISSRIIWLYGETETGKPNIARSIAKWCENKQILLASFFFSRTDFSRNNLKQFVATLSYAIADSIPECKSAIGLAVESDPHIFSRFVERQFDRLCAKPLCQLVQHVGTAKQLPYVFVINALDECVNPDERAAVIRLFWSTLSNNEQLLWKILITSRFEETIQDSIASTSDPDFFVRIALDQNDASGEAVETMRLGTPTSKISLPHMSETRPILDGDPLVFKSYTFGALSFKILRVTSNCARHPSITLTVPTGTVILGGGAYVDWDIGPPTSEQLPGNMLTAMYPNEIGTAWTVASKDHIQVSKARIAAYCIVARMNDGSPIPPDDYTIVSGTSAVPAANPQMQVYLPPRFIVVGGGARVNYTGYGNMLYASHPTDQLRGWIGSAKDHIHSDPATITVWAIGLRESFLKNTANMQIRSFRRTSSSSPGLDASNHPTQMLVIPNIYLTGVGARVHWKETGNLLTACFPKDPHTVVVEGKDHILAEPSAITAYAIGFSSGAGPGAGVIETLYSGLPASPLPPADSRPPEE